MDRSKSLTSVRNAALFRSDPSYQTALTFLYERINYERASDHAYDPKSFRLQRMSRLLDRLGNPHLASKVIHVAGTKGKGSVAWLLAETLRRSGYKTGLYTSPHLLNLEERFVFESKACEPGDLVELVQILQQAEQSLLAENLGQLTFFELTTALGWLYFARSNADVCVVEVGLGGRLDSTNVCRPELCVITSISFDHQAQLGHTISAIAGEKAGIIKPNTTVVSGARHPDAFAQIQSVAKDQAAELRQIDRDFQVLWIPPSSSQLSRAHQGLEPLLGGTLQFRSSSGELELPVRMLGEHQSINGGIAMAAIECLQEKGWTIPLEAIQHSFAETQIAARNEICGSMPWIVVDSAHNMASVKALHQTLDSYFQVDRRILVFSASRDKDYVGMLQELVPIFDVIVLTQFQSNPRSVPLPALTEACHIAIANNANHPCQIQTSSTPENAWQYARSIAKSSDLICIAGSFFLAAELLPSARSQK